MRFFSLLAVTFCLAFGSCKTQKGVIQNYLEDLRDTTMGKEISVAEPVIQKNDLLSVQVSSASLNPQVDQLYNQAVAVGAGEGSASGYLVDQKGNLELPRIGAIHAEGLTKSQLADSIKLRLEGQLSNPSVVIRYQNFRVVVLGEVGAPGVKTVPVENLTLLEALAMSGDITQYGKKKEVKVLRENGGKRQLGIVDVTTSKMFESPYFQLQQNDVVMIEQTGRKLQLEDQQRAMRQVTWVLSIITAVSLLYNIFR